MKSVAFIIGLLIACSCFAQDEKKTYTIDQIAGELSSHVREGWAKEDGLPAARFRDDASKLLRSLRGCGFNATNLVLKSLSRDGIPANAYFDTTCKIDRVAYGVSIACSVEDEFSLSKLEKAVAISDITEKQEEAKKSKRMVKPSVKSMKPSVYSVSGTIRDIYWLGFPKRIDITIADAVLK